MRKGFLGSLSALVAGASLSFSQSPMPVMVVPANPLAAPQAGVKTGTPVIMDMKNPQITSTSAVMGNSNCGSEGCCVQEAGNGPCGPPGRFWASAEYLTWWIKDSHLPPLVTTSAPLSGGALGSGTTVLFGGSDLDHESFSGARFTAGYWLNDCQTLGIEGSYFFLGDRSNNAVFGASGANGSALISRPFTEIGTGLPTAELVAFPGLASGTVTVSNRSRLQGAEANAIENLCCCCNYRVDLLAGFRYLNLDESLGIQENITLLPTAPSVTTFGGVPIGPGTNIVATDNISTHNDFYGGQVGVRGEYRRGKAFVDLTGKIALGVTHETVDMSGSSRITNGTTSVVAPGGLLATDGNIGHYSRSEFAVVPEVGINVGYQVTDHLRAFAGYTFMYWSDVVRPENAIPPNLNSTRSPTSIVAPTGPANPAFNFNSTDFWAQGINLGLEFRY